MGTIMAVMVVMVVMEWVMEVTMGVVFMDLGIMVSMAVIMEVYIVLVVTNYAITQLLIEEMNDQAICHQNGTQTSEVLQDLPGETHTYQGQLQELAADLVHRLWLPIREGLLQPVLIRNRLSVAAELFRASQTSGQVLFKEHLPITNRRTTVPAGLTLRVITIQE